MKRLNEIVNFLLGKGSRHYAVEGVMSEGASIQHPLEAAGNHEAIRQ